MESWRSCWHLVVQLQLCGMLLMLANAGVLCRMLSHDMWKHRERTIMSEVIHISTTGLRRQLQSAPYCVASASADQTKLQDALDWACGTPPNGGGVDCSAILQTGSCYNPNTLHDHASYAFDYYYIQQNGAPGTCDFGGVATTTATDPSSGSCVYPSMGSGVPSTSTGGNSNSSSSSSSTTFTPTGGNSSSTTFGNTTASNNAHASSSLLLLLWVHALCALVVLLLLLFS